MGLKRLIPDTIAARIVHVLLVGLTISHVASLAIYYGDPVTALTLLGRAHIAERIGTVTRLVERTPLQSRDIVLEASRDAGLSATLVKTRNDLPDTGDWQGRLLKSVLTEHLGGIDVTRVRVSHGRTTVRAAASRSKVTSHESLLVSVRLNDGTWLKFETPESATRSYFSVRFMLSMGLMVITVIIGAVWAVRRLTAPLTTFANAAERLGVDVAAPQLPEAGPSEVRTATRAFNEMQRRLRRFIEDRMQLVASISHDLRTPITRLKLRAEFVEDAEQQAKMLADLDEMEAMINSTLSFARDDASAERRETVDLVALLHSLCDDLGDAGHPVSFEGEGRLPYHCGPIALRRALGNLIDNALKYGSRAAVTLAEEVGMIVIRVDDDGSGIPDDRIEDVFRPFHRLEESRNRETGGTGLGLTVARSAIRGHGGELRLLNRPDGGLRAEVSLPLRQQ